MREDAEEVERQINEAVLEANSIVRDIIKQAQSLTVSYRRRKESIIARPRS